VSSSCAVILSEAKNLRSSSQAVEAKLLLRSFASLRMTARSFALRKPPIEVMFRIYNLSFTIHYLLFAIYY